jgi:hypothetical protein
MVTGVAVLCIVTTVLLVDAVLVDSDAQSSLVFVTLPI